jgi:hypothetical protein
MSYAATIYLIILALSLVGIYRHDGELVKLNFAHHALLALVILSLLSYGGFFS